VLATRWPFCAERLVYDRRVVLYTCTDGKAFGSMPGLMAHPCGRAAVALDGAGHAYEWRKVKGGTVKFWTWGSRAQDRADVERLSGQRSVPILVLDDGAVITGSGEIARWARENAPAVRTD
jgi:glutathione S-transferase-like protein